MRKIITLCIILLICFNLFSYEEPLNVKDKNFGDKIKGKGKLFFVLFYESENNDMSEMAEPVFKSVAGMVNDYMFLKININNSPKLKKKFEAEKAPYILAIKHKNIFVKYDGIIAVENLNEWCNTVIEKYHREPYGVVIKINEKNYEKKTKDRLVFLYFQSDKCKYCKKFNNSFKKVAFNFPTHMFAKIDVKKSEELTDNFKVYSIPFLVAVYNGKKVAKFKDERTTENYRAWVKGLIEKYKDKK